MKNKIILMISIIFLILAFTIIGLLLGKNFTEKTYQTNTINLNDIKKISDSNCPIIPNGFKKIDTSNANWEISPSGTIRNNWYKGLIIEDGNGNQFVWIPVDSIEKYNSTDFNESSESSYTKYSPDIATKEELIQIKKYGGFYISRYEAGSPNDISQSSSISSITNNIVSTPLSKKSALPWNFISKENARKSAQKMYNTNSISSDIITSRLWVYINNWLDKAGYIISDPVDYGNFSNSKFNFTGSYSINSGETYTYENNLTKTKNILISTGISDKNLTNNIYDFYGNVAELTISNNKTYNIYGGSYDNISTNGDFSKAEISSKIGFRIMLYLK